MSGHGQKIYVITCVSLPPSDAVEPRQVQNQIWISSVLGELSSRILFAFEKRASMNGHLLRLAEAIQQDPEFLLPHKLKSPTIKHYKVHANCVDEACRPIISATS